MRLKQKVAIVTGGASGIGKATAELFAQEGAKVVVADWNKEAGVQTASTLSNAGHNALYCFADVSKSQDVEVLVQTTVNHYGKLDVLVNNAAVQILARLVETAEEVWDRIQSVNLKGVFLGCKFAIPPMIKGGGG